MIVVFIGHELPLFNTSIINHITVTEYHNPESGVWYNIVMYHIRQMAEAEIEIKKSRFIGILIPVDNEEDVKDLLISVRKKYPSATHYCTALSINGRQRSNDDGEPSGTAGLPMLECLRHKELDNVLAVVVRYFGGTLLGTGGLVRAYQQAVNKAIENAVITRPVEKQKYRITVPYDLSSKAETILARQTILERDYLDQVTYTFLSDSDISEQFLAVSSGTVKPELIETVTVEETL